MIFKTYEEQILILKERNLLIENEEFAYEKLKSDNYYNIINGYKELFLLDNTVEEYIENCTFEEIFKLYSFDRELRNLIFNATLKIENIFRAQISYVFSEYHSPSGYLEFNNFETYKNATDNQDTISNQAIKIHRLISSIQSDISKSIKYKPFIKHYIFNHEFIPLWVLVNAISLTRLSTFYSLMLQAERVEIAKYWNIKENELNKFIQQLAFFRNLCAHDDRIFCAKNYLLIPSTNIHELLGIPKDSDNNHIYGKNDLFSLMIIFKKLLSKEDFRTLFNKVSGRIFSLEQNIQCISFDKILKSMGFPENWRNLKELDI